MEIVIGFQGKEHVTPGQLGRIIGGLAGTGEYVLETQNELAATMQSANQIQISTGDLVMQGRGATVEAPETLTIESGVSGQNRNDLVVARYEKNASSSVEKCELKVIKGTAVSGTATDPSCTKGDIIGGDLVNEMPLWRVPIEGITPGTPVKLFETIPSIDGLRDFVSQRPLSFTPNRALASFLSFINNSYRIGDTVTIQCAIVLSSDTDWQSEELRLFDLPGDCVPRQDVSRNRQLITFSSDGRSYLRSLKIGSDGRAYFVQSGTTQNVRYVLIPGISYTL